MTMETPTQISSAQQHSPLLARIGACILLSITLACIPFTPAFAEDTSFDPRPLGLISSERNQAPWGTCWDFAGMAALESSLIVSGLADSNIDLSEEAVFWATMTQCVEADGTYPFSGWNNASRNSGGFGDIMTGYFATGKGPKLECDVPYRTDETYNGFFYPASRPTNVDEAPIPFQVTDIVYFDHPSNDNTKAAIRSYGAIVSGCNLSLDYYQADPTSSDGTLWYKNFDSEAYIGHAVAVVGWDDEFDRNRFAPDKNGTLPTADGAWLVKNSELAEGIAPYIWISYEDDAVLTTNDHNPLYAFGNVRETQERKVHGVDKNGAVSLYEQAGSLTCANVFEFAENESLSECMFMSLSQGAEYRLLWMPVNANGSPLATDSAVIELASGTVPHAGYVTVELDNPATIPPGKGALALELSGDSTSIGIDTNISLAGRPLYSANTRGNAGQSYFIDRSETRPALDSSNDPISFSLRAFCTTTEPEPEPGIDPQPDPEPEPPTPIPPQSEVELPLIPSEQTNQAAIHELPRSGDTTTPLTSALAAVCLAGLCTAGAVRFAARTPNQRR